MKKERVIEKRKREGKQAPGWREKREKRERLGEEENRKRECVTKRE